MPSHAGGGRRREIRKSLATVAAVAHWRGVDPCDIEARIGQTIKITAVGPGAAAVYAICPAAGKAVGLILSWCNTATTNLHFAAISADVPRVVMRWRLLDVSARLERIRTIRGTHAGGRTSAAIRPEAAAY